MQIIFFNFLKGQSQKIVLFFVFFLILLSSIQSHARSRWGLGLGTGYLPDYPAAAQGRQRFLLFPVYRGKLFRIDRVTGVSGDVYNDSRVDFSWNFIFQFPTDSELIPARQGMRDLDWVLSLGPEFKYFIYRSQNHVFFFRFPVRQNTCTDFSRRTRFCGVAFNPGFRHVYYSPSLGEFTLRAEAFSDSSEYQQYFFQVNQEDSTARRQTFHARAGFLGFVTGLFHSIPFEGWDFSSAFNLYDYSLAINQNSPLFIHKTNVSVFFAVTIDL